MNRPPAFQFYVKDWPTSKKRAAMDLEQQAAYLNLLCHMWDTDDCSLPNDPVVLANLSELREKWNERSGPVQRAFDDHPKKPGFITNDRLNYEHKKYRDFQRKASMAGRASGLSRKQARQKDIERTFSERSTNVEPTLNSSILSSSSSSSSSQNPKKSQKKSTRHLSLLNGYQAGFDIFWKAYPKKRGKGQAEKAWAKIKPDDFLLGVRLAKIEQAIKTDDWTKEHRKYVPHPATWLNGKGWEDDYSPPVSNGATRRLVL